MKSFLEKGVSDKDKEKIERKGYQKNHFVSPIFGTRVKDEVVIPNENSGDLTNRSPEEIKSHYLHNLRSLYLQYMSAI